jgi:hypothetical protein
LGKTALCTSKDGRTFVSKSEWPLLCQSTETGRKLNPVELNSVHFLRTMTPKSASHCARTDASRSMSRLSGGFPSPCETIRIEYGRKPGSSTKCLNLLSLFYEKKTITESLTEKRWENTTIRGQSHQHFTRSFLSRRSQRAKKTDGLIVFFFAFGICARVKASLKCW